MTDETSGYQVGRLKVTQPPDMTYGEYMDAKLLAMKHGWHLRYCLGSNYDAQPKARGPVAEVFTPGPEEAEPLLFMRTAAEVREWLKKGCPDGTANG